MKLGFSVKNIFPYWNWWYFLKRNRHKTLNCALLQIGASSYYKLGQLFYYKLGQEVITNWGSFVITNWGNFYYKLGQVLQIGARFITNWGRYYKLGQSLLQIVAGITNWGNLLQIRAQQY